jgi:hypothetical protein
VARVNKLLWIFSCALGFAALPAGAQQWPLQGNYAVNVAASDNIETAVVKGTADMNFAIRSLARSRIAKTNPLYEHIQLWRNDTQVIVQFDSRKPIEMPADGHTILWVREDGGKYDVSAKLSATQLVMHFQADDGERTNVFVLEPDGVTLHLNVKLESRRLPGPITYVLSYRRQ